MMYLFISFHTFLARQRQLWNIFKPYKKTYGKWLEDLLNTCINLIKINPAWEDQMLLLIDIISFYPYFKKFRWLLTVLQLIIGDLLNSKQYILFSFSEITHFQIIQTFVWILFLGKPFAVSVSTALLNLL